MLEVERLSKIYANRGDGPAGGLQEASFSLAGAAFLALLGPSGCGKTTTLRCVAGLERPDRGLIRVDDEIFFDAARGTAVPINLRRIGMVFQSYAIWPHMSVFENVAFPLRVARDEKFTAGELAHLVEEALARVSLDGFGSRPATRLSGGQQQRVALARAIVRRPRLLLLDEPLSNLDAALREEMRNELRRLQQEIGVTTVYVTHDQAEALEMSDRIAVMSQGRIVQMGNPQEIYFRPANRFVADFVGTTNWLTGRLGDARPEGLRDMTLGSGRGIICVAPAATGEAQVSIRPENLALHPIEAPRLPDTNRLEGNVVFAGFLGAINRYQVDIGDAVLQAYAGASARHKVGDRVALDFSFRDAVALTE